MQPRLTIFAALAFCWALQVCAADWPEWRGAGRAGVWTESGIVETIPTTGLKVVWRAPVGMGYSSPVIVGGRVFVSDAELRKPKVREGIRCLDADSGKEVWSYFYETPAPDWFFTEEQGRGPGATPVVRVGKIYALDLFGNAICLGARRGNLIWKRNLKEEFQARETSLDASPLVEGNLLILMLGGKNGAGVVGLDRNSGREVWRALDEAVTWSSPIVVNAGGARQLIVWMQQSVSSLDPRTGKLYWREETQTGGSPGTAGVSTPVFRGDRLLVSGWMLQLETNRPAAHTVWPESKGVARRILSDTSTGALIGDYVYGAKAGGEFVCLKVSSGEEVWKSKSLTEPANGASIQITVHGERVFLFNDRGELIEARLSPAGCQEMSRTKLIEPTSPFGSRKFAWSTPSFARRNIYVRNDRELVCASLSASSYR